MNEESGFPRLTFKVSFEMSARAKDVEWFGRPTDEWLEEMVAGPGSIWRLRDVSVTEDK